MKFLKYEIGKDYTGEESLDIGYYLNNTDSVDELIDTLSTPDKPHYQATERTDYRPPAANVSQ